MKSDKEIIKILAKHILKHYMVRRVYSRKCRFCYGTTEMQGMVASDHKPDCPVLLAEEVLTSKVYEDVSDIILNDSCVGCPFGIENKGQDLNIWCKEGYKYPEHGICFTKVRVLLKPETVILQEPLIVHNVMKYKGDYYLRQLGDCTDCSFHGILCHNDIDIIKFGYQTKCIDTNTVWKSFKDIQITDELACMRKDIGDIYLTYDNKEGLILYSVRGSRLITSSYDDRDPIFNDPEYIRLATAEEIQKYLKE